MRQLRLMFTAVLLVAAFAASAALALADERPSATKTATSATSETARDATAPKITLPAVDEKRLETATDQFLTERERYRELQRSGAPTDKVDAQRQQMERARDQMRTLRQKACPVQAGASRRLGSGRHGRGSGMGPGNGMVQGAGMGRGQGRGGQGMGRGGPGGGRGQGMCGPRQGGGGMGRGAGMGPGRGLGRGGGMGRGRGWCGGLNGPGSVTPATGDAER